MKILIIGGGNMGITYAQSFLRSHITNHEDMMILEKSERRARELEQMQVGHIFLEPETCLAIADLIIFAVKPQDTAVLFNKIRRNLDEQQVFLSIMAGVKIQTLTEDLGIKKVVRAMPNLPAQIGLGMTAFTSTDEVTRMELVMVQNLLNTTGKTVYVENEALIDAATAISGSGPAYVWFFMDALIKAGQEMGFSVSEAELLVSQTFRGAIDLYETTEHSCSEWIKKVSSRGGTTEAAMKSFQGTDLYKDIMSGARAALERAHELGSLEK